MDRFTKSELEEMIVNATEYFKQTFPSGATFDIVKKCEEVAFKKYIGIYTKNIQSGNTRYNSKCKKARDIWFTLESIKCIMEVNNLSNAVNLDFCIDNLDQQSDLLGEFINSHSYQSYLQEQDFNR